jgi:hypothetical protein
MVQSSVARCRSSYAPGRPRSARARPAGASSGCSERAVQCIATQQERVLATARGDGLFESDVSGSSRVPLRCPNPRGSPAKAGESSSAPAGRKSPVSSDLRTESGLHVLLAMQKVEGSNPFSRFPGMRLYRASNSILTAPLDAVLGKGFPADYPLATQTPASGVGSSASSRVQPSTFLSRSTATPPISSTCW